MRTSLFVLAMLAGLVTGCAPEPEFEPDDPRSCEDLRSESPELYEDCMDALN